MAHSGPPPVGINVASAPTICETKRGWRHFMSPNDLTAEEDPQRTRALLAAIVASSEDAIVSKTLEGIVTSWNEAAERLFGFSASEMIGQSITRIIPENLQFEEVDILAKLRRGERI